MPNWCKNAMLITGKKEDIESFVSKVETLESDFDFNGIIPMPETLSVEASSIAEKAYAVYYGDKYTAQRALGATSDAEFEEKFKEYQKDLSAKKLADTYHFNKTNYGHTTWYEWSIQAWGTKWNAFEASQGELIQVAQSELYQLDYFFETAWDFPKKVYATIAQQYPELVFSIDVDEEGGFFWGNITIKDGEVIHDLKEGTRPGGPYDYGDEEDEE